MDLGNTLGAINSIWSGEDSRGKRIRLDPELEEVCGWWEMVDGHGDVIGEDLEAAAHNAFVQFSQTYCDLRNPLPELKTKKVQQTAPSGGDKRAN